MISLSTFLNRKFSSILLLCNFITLAVFLIVGTVWGYFSTQKTLKNEISNSSSMVTTLMYDKNWDVITQHLDSLVSVQQFSEITLKSLNGDILTRMSSPNFSLMPKTCINQNSQIFNIEACAPILSQKTLNLIIGVILFYTSILILIYLMAKNYFFKAMNALVKDVEGILSEEALAPATAEISEIQKIKENFLEKTQSLKKAAEDAAYINFSKKVIHDLMSPISVISQLTSKESLDIKDIRYLKESSDNLEKISNSLLQKKKKNHLFPGNTRFQLLKELNQIVLLKRLEISYQEKNLIISTNIAESASLWINPTSVKRILSNILNNSLQASSQKDTQLIINLVSDESTLTLSFEDNCGGFDERTLDLLNSGLEISTKNTGHGFGLSSLREYINTLDGQIQFSNRGNSAYIEIFLPKRLDTTMSPIVLIDDDKYIRYSWEQEAKVKGYRLHAYSSYSDFLKDAEKLERDSEIFIDSDLKHESRGEDLIDSILGLGFYKVSIESGRRPQDFKNVKNINNVIPKKFPY